MRPNHLKFKERGVKWDMERIRKNCLKTDRMIKFFEVSKEIFQNLEGFSPLEKKNEIWQRLANKINIVRLPCQKIIIASDIGTTGSPSEVGIFFGIILVCLVLD